MKVDGAAIAGRGALRSCRRQPDHRDRREDQAHAGGEKRSPAGRSRRPAPCPGICARVVDPGCLPVDDAGQASAARRRKSLRITAGAAGCLDGESRWPGSSSVIWPRRYPRRVPEDQLGDAGGARGGDRDEAGTDLEQGMYPRILAGAVIATSHGRGQAVVRRRPPGRSGRCCGERSSSSRRPAPGCQPTVERGRVQGTRPAQAIEAERVRVHACGPVNARAG